METAISYLTVLPLSGGQQDEFARQVIETVKCGNIDPLRLDIQLKAIENTIDAIRKAPSVKEAVINEYQKYLGEGKEVQLHGAKVKVSERKSYEYNNAKLAAMEKEKEQLEARIKAFKILLQTQDADPETGEVFEKPIIKSTQVVTIKF